MSYTFNIFAVQGDTVPGQGTPLFTIDSSTVPSSATFYAGVTSWIVGDTDDTMVYPANTVLTSGQVLNSVSGTYYNIYPNGGVYYYNDPSDITNSTGSVLYIDQVEASPGIYQIRGDPDNQSNWNVVSQLNGNSAIVGTSVNYLDTSPLSGSNNSPPATYFLAIAQVAPPTITITLYAETSNAQNGGADGSAPRLAQFTGTTYTVPTATGVYGGVTKWQVIITDDIGVAGEILTSGSTFNSNGIHFSLVPLGGVFYYNNESDVFNNRENPIYIDQSTISGNNDVFQVLATSENQTSWVVTGGSSGLAGREVAVGSNLLTGASTNFGYSLAKVIPPTPPPTPSVTFTFYASVANAQNGGSSGSGPRLAQSTGTTYTVPTATGVYGGVTAWVIRQTNDSTGTYTVGTIINSLETLATPANDTYYNLSPSGGVFYYDTESDITNSSETPLYIDQSTISGNNDVYNVVATSANQSSWLVDSQSGGNQSTVDVEVNVGNVTSLTGAAQQAIYYLVKVQAPPPANITFTLYATEEDGINGGSSGSAPRLAQFTSTTYTIPTAAGVYGGVTRWIVSGTNDNTIGTSGPGTLLVAGTTFNGNGTYYNLAPYGAVFYYNTANDVTNSPETPIYIDQSTISGNNGVYQVLATSENQTSWVVNDSDSGDLIGETILVGSNSLTDASVLGNYYLVKVQAPPPANIRFTLYTTEEAATNGTVIGNQPRLAQFDVTTYTVPTATGVYAGVTKWRVILSDDANSLASGTYLTSGTTFSGTGTYYNLAPFGAVFYYDTADDITSSSETPIYIDQSTVSGNNDVYNVVATTANQSSWLVDSQSGGNQSTVDVEVNVGNVTSLTGATQQAIYYLVPTPGTPPPPTSVKITLYAKATDAQNGGSSGSAPRLAQFTGTTYSVPSGTGVYGGVTKWIIAATDDDGSNGYGVGELLVAGTTFDGNGTYYNLAPFGAVLYYNSASDVINSPETPIYIDQSTISGNNDVYQVLATSANQTSWVINSQLNGNSTVVGQTVAVGANTLTGANNSPSAFYYLVKDQPNSQTSVKLTLYAKSTDAQNGGPNGNGPRLAQFTSTTVTGQIFTLIAPTGVYGGVTYWTVQSSDSNLPVGEIVAASTISADNTGTYFNLSPFGGVFYYNTASDITSNPNTPIYIDQSTIEPAGDVYNVVATSANQTSWVINSQLNGVSTIVGETVAVNATRLGGANNQPSAFYYLVKVQAPRPPCFLEGSTILTDNGYVTIESIRPGMLVQTNLDGLKKVEFVGYSSIYNPSSSDRLKNRLYVCKKDNYPELTEDLVLTGDHSILVDDITDEERELMIESLGRIFVTSNKYRLTAQADERSDPYPIEGTFNVWHLALENDLDNTNYGIYANGGLLVESAPIKALKTKENVTLV